LTEEKVRGENQRILENSDVGMPRAPGGGINKTGNQLNDSH